jgi:hypothetical protein
MYIKYIYIYIFIYNLINFEIVHTVLRFSIVVNVSTINLSAVQDVCSSMYVLFVYTYKLLRDCPLIYLNSNQFHYTIFVFSFTYFDFSNNYDKINNIIVLIMVGFNSNL